VWIVQLGRLAFGGKDACVAASTGVGGPSPDHGETAGRSSGLWILRIVNIRQANEAELIEVLDRFCSGFASRDTDAVPFRLRP
jgi:hypothetical protein